MRNSLLQIRSAALLVLAACLLVTPVYAGEKKEKSVSTRDRISSIMDPDREKEFIPRGRSGMELKEFNAPNAQIRPFLFKQQYFEKKFLSKEFLGTRTFHSETYQTESFDSGENLYTSDGEAVLTSASNANIEQFRQSAQTKEFATEAAYDADEKSPQSGETFPDKRPIPIEEITSADDKPSDADAAAGKTMDVQAVRELLNKN